MTNHFREGAIRYKPNKKLFGRQNWYQKLCNIWVEEKNTVKNIIYFYTQPAESCRSGRHFKITSWLSIFKRGIVIISNKVKWILAPKNTCYHKDSLNNLITGKGRKIVEKNSMLEGGISPLSTSQPQLYACFHDFSLRTRFIVKKSKSLYKTIADELIYWRKSINCPLLKNALHFWWYQM